MLFRSGLVTRVVPAADLDGAATALAEELAAAPDFFATIDGLALALKDRTAAFKRLGELKELFEITTPNKRIQLEEILLMI